MSAALSRLRAAPGRTAAAAVAVVLAAAMAGAAVTVATALTGGFDRAASQADLPDVIARFAPVDRASMARRLAALPGVDSFAFRTELDHLALAGGTGASQEGVVQAVEPGRRGYAIVAGRDVGGDGREAVVEQGVARTWKLHLGDMLDAGPLGSLRVVGIGRSPDNVAFPLAATPRIYVSAAALGARPLAVNIALLWEARGARTEVTLQQARATSFGVRDLRFVTRSGVRVLIDQGAGLVVALLAAFSLVALGAATVLLVAGAHADVQRRLGTIGLARAIGFPRRAIAAEQAAAAGLVAAPAAAFGLAAGALATRGPAADLLASLNEAMPATPVGMLALALAAIVALVAIASAWPAWRAARRPVLELLRGGDLAGAGRRSTRRRVGAWFRPAILRRQAPAASTPTRPETPPASPRPAGLLALGARLGLARRGRALATVAALSAAVGVLALMLALASAVAALRDDPSAIGRHYQLTALLPPDEVSTVRAIPGVAAAAPRYAADGADSFTLGEPVHLVAFRGDHTRYEAPPLASGRRLRTEREAEVGAGLAEALGLHVGGTLAVQLPRGERRWRVAGIVRALDHDGREAWVRPKRLLSAADPSESIAVRLRSPSDAAGVTQRLTALGAAPTRATAATPRGAGFVGTLATLLRAVAVVNALACLHALVQALAMTVRDRRPTLALLRAVGAPPSSVGLVLAAAAAVLALPSAAAGLALERWVLGPLVARHAAGYADLPITTTAGQAAAVVAGACLLAGLAAALVGRNAIRVPIAAGLAEE